MDFVENSSNLTSSNLTSSNHTSSNLTSSNLTSSNLTSSTTEQKKPEVKLVDVVVTDENVALNVLVSFLSLAQRRGAFGIDESAKIWECVQKFQKKP